MRKNKAAPFIAIFFLLMLFPSLLFCQTTTYKSAWRHEMPYQYLENDNSPTLTGYDILLLNQIFNDLDKTVTYDDLPLDKQIAALQSGQLDIIAGISMDNTLKNIGYFSIPYRTEHEELYMREKDIPQLSFSNIDELINHLKTGLYRVGIYEGETVVPEKLNAFFINNLGKYDYITTYANIDDLTQALKTNAIDIIFLDRNVATVAQFNANHIVAHPNYHFKKDIYFLLSKKQFDATMVAAINQEIQTSSSTFKPNNLWSKTVFAQIINAILQEHWFLFLNILGIIAFSISGFLIAHDEKYSFFGALVLGASPAIGGGIIRDVILNRDPIAILKEPLFIGIIILTMITSAIVLRCEEYIVSHWLYAYIKKHPVFSKLSHLPWIQYFDAIGLAAFTVTGVAITIEAGVQPLLLWGPFFAVITSCGGGIVRDMLRQHRHIAVFQGSFYAEISMICALILSAVLLFKMPTNSPKIIKEVLISMVVVIFALRLFIITFKIERIFLFNPRGELNNF